MSDKLAIRIPKDASLPDNGTHTNRFEIKSASSDRKYIIAQKKATGSWGCSCPGWIRNRNCKHLKALGLPCFEVPFEATLKAGE
jgi:hypothetical protein